MPHFQITLQTRDRASPNVRFLSHEMTVEAASGDEACALAHKQFFDKHREAAQIRGVAQLQPDDLARMAVDPELRVPLAGMEGQEADSEPNEPMPPENPRERVKPGTAAGAFSRTRKTA